jgi:phosphoribosylaminoimidazolecarboxamide formyltransferase/IMP cyclohydrolase
LGFELLSTGGTLEVLKKQGIPAVKVSDYTGSPEILGGRVKTLHPRIHGGILARLDRQEDQRDLSDQHIQPISLVAVNLYPFRQTTSEGEAAATEQIDIGGPTLVRAAAKNFKYVTVVVDPADYEAVLSELRANRQVSEGMRRRLMRKAFAHTAAYDASISEYFQLLAKEPFPDELTLAVRKRQALRYGENPHQAAAFYRIHSIPSGPTVAFADVLQGKELSYNNLLDLDAALALMLEFREDTCAAIVKHNTPCGLALGEELASAYRRARAIDDVSAFGGIVALSRDVE